jgi:hypothetical protein
VETLVAPGLVIGARRRARAQAGVQNRPGSRDRAGAENRAPDFRAGGKSFGGFLAMMERTLAERGEAEGVSRSAKRKAGQS